MTDFRNYRLENITVAIIDDHEVVLEGFRSFMEKSGVGCVKAFCKAQQLLDVMQQYRFDVYIVDVELPDMNVSDFIDRIRLVHPEARIIVNTIHDEIWVVSKLMEKNVNGVMYKTAHLEQLLEAIVSVSQGHRFYCTKFKKTQQRLQLQNDIPSQREIEVLRAIAKGYSTKEIGPMLFISENTVENHRKNLFRKLQANNMASLIVKAIAAGYLNPDEMA
jgi:DNA-binding NarL/FixJ family response regulator